MRRSARVMQRLGRGLHFPIVFSSECWGIQVAYNYESQRLKERYASITIYLYFLPSSPYSYLNFVVFGYFCPPPPFCPIRLIIISVSENLETAQSAVYYTARRVCIILSQMEIYLAYWDA